MCVTVVVSLCCSMGVGVVVCVYLLVDVVADVRLCCVMFDVALLALFDCLCVIAFFVFVYLF